MKRIYIGVTLLLFLVAIRASQLHYPETGQPSFQRDAVEQNPSMFRTASNWNEPYTDLNYFGSKALPLRTAVEFVPDKLSSRLPLRDAIERRLPPDEPIDLEIDLDFDLDRNQFSKVSTPQKISQSYPIERLQEIIGLVSASQTTSSNYRISNPHHKLLAFRGGRNLKRFQHGNENLREKSQQQYFGYKSTSNRDLPRLVCNIDGSAVHRKEPLAFHSKYLDPRTCTHIIYAFATIDPRNYVIVPRDHNYDVVRGGYRAVTGMKRLNPHLKVLISIGDVREEGGHKYSDIVSSASRRRSFIKSLINFLDEYDFDGIDLHWQYPGAEELGGRATDKMNLNLFLEELSEIFQSRDWLLSVSVPASRFRVEDGYDPKILASVVDFVNLQAYDFHVEREPVADHHSPLLRREKETGLNVFFNADYAVRYWLRRGLPRSKLNLGVPFYGRSFTLRYANQTNPGSGVRGPGKPGLYTQTPGILAYYEICNAVMNEGWTTGTDNIGSPYAFNGEQWVGYETADSLEKKAMYVKDVGLGGISVWAVDLDDFQGICGEKFSLLNVVRRSLYNEETNAISDSAKKLPLCSEGDGLFSDPTDCSKYTICRDGTAYHLHCTNNQMYDVTNGRCGFIRADNCQPGQVIYTPSSRYHLDLMLEQHLKVESQKKSPKVICYLTNWAFYRKSEGKFVPEHLDTRLCTHVVYAFASLHPEQLILKEFDPWVDFDNNFYSRATSSFDVPVLLAIGGWTDSSGDKYSRLISDGSARRRFVTTAVSFLRKHNFNGLHLDWNYPVCWQSNCNKGPSSDKINFAKLVQELRTEFDKQQPSLLLGAAISGYKEVINVAYDLKSLGENLDFMSVMTYDYHGHWERKTGHVSPLYYQPGDTYPQYNSNYTMELLVSLGAPREKLLLGIPFYGQSFKLSGTGNRNINTLASGPGEEGEYTKQPGMLAYYEICNRVRNQNWQVNRDPKKSSGPYAYQNSQWVGYDDPESVREKANYITKNGFGGAVAWTVDLDDFTNRCCQGPFPLLKSLNRGLGLLRDSPPSREDCTKPAEPITPPAPLLTTGVDSGAMSSTTEMSTSTKNSTTWWTTSSTSSTTWWNPITESTTWWKPVTDSTTTSPWWTTTKASTTTTTTTTTMKTTTPSSTTMSWWSTTKDNRNSALRFLTSGLKRSSFGSRTKPERATTRTDCVVLWCVCHPPYPSAPRAIQSVRVVARSGLVRLPKELRFKPEVKNLRALNRKPDIATTTTKTTTQSWWQPSETTTIPPPAVIAPVPENGNDGKPCTSNTYIPDKNNCNTYYRCILGELRRQNCASGLHWNPRRNLCDWPNNAKCMENSSSTTLKPSTTSTSKPTTTTIISTTESALDNSISCVNGQYYPHELCNKFYVCVNGHLVQQACGPGLQWSVQQNSCDWGFKINCDARKGITSLNVIKQHVKDSDQPCEAGSYSSLNGDCSHYKMCLWGKYETFNCANGLHWNNAEQICDWPANAKCDETLASTTATKKPFGIPTSTVKTTNSWQPTTTTTTVRPSTTTEQPEPLSGYFKIVCYFTNWAWYRRGLGKYTPENIDPNLCTHIVYGFAVLDYENLIVKAHDSWADFDNKFYERVVAYKSKGLKVSLALGGWNDSAGDKYSRLVNNPAARARFIKHVLNFLEKYNFDGLDLDWEYPKCWQVDCKKGPDSDKPAFASFIKELSKAFKPKGYLLSAAVSPSKTVIDAGYDVPALAKYLDWVAVMTYDYHGQWDKKTGHVAPLYLHPDDDITFFNANFSINYWISEGVPRRNIVMGMPLYGQSFQLEKEANNGLNAKAPGPGQAGEFTRAAGFLAYYEICDRIKNKGWTVVQDTEHRMGPLAFKGNQWVSFDDPEMIRRKAQYIRELDLGGGMVWALDLDDFRDRCGQGVHPLMNVIRDVLQKPGTGIVTEEPLKPQPTQKPTQQPTFPVVTTTLKPVPQTTSQPTRSESQFKVVCYFTNWAWYRQAGGKYLPSDINPNLCTHIVYGFAVLNGDQLVIKSHDPWADFDNKFYEKVTAFKAKGIKVLVAIGGWNDSAGDKYSRLVNSPSARSRFISNVIDFIEKNNFDGLDLDWEYPKCWQVDCNKGPESDKAAFAEFVKELRQAFNPKGLLLSAAVSPAKKVVDAGYDVPVLSKYLDWIAVMCYDYHGQWDKITGHVAPMYVHPEDVDVTFNANFTIHYWISKGADRRKIVMGMPMYGQSFSLADNNIHGLNAPSYGGGEAGEATRARGFLSYYEICQNIQKKGWIVVRDPKGRIGPYAYLRDQWVSFDDIAMIKEKSEYIKKMGLGGGMIWALDLDDFKNYCGCEEYPLLKTINRVLRDYPSTEQSCKLDSTELRGDAPTSVPTPPLPLPCNGESFAPHPTNCNQYLLCLQGQLAPQSCPAGLYWNREQRHCDWPENAACHPDVILRPEEPHREVEVERPVVKPGVESEYKVVCYFTNWAWYRQGDGKYKPEDIDSDLCTHITYGFAVLDSNSLTIKPHDSWADIDNEFYHKVTTLKQKGIKVLIAIGGWNDSLGPKYSLLVNSIEARQRFITHVVEFIDKWGFDGLDLDWEYPKCWQVDCSKGPDSDKQGFAALVRELSAVFRPRGWLLSAAVSPSKAVIDAGYDVPVLAEHFDWIAVMTYDFHGHWDKQTGHVAPLFYYPGDTYDYFNANFSLHYWLEKGTPPQKLIMGLPLYGQSFTLADTSVRGLNSKSYGPGEAGEFTRAGGFLAFYEICERVKSRSWSVTRDPEGRIGPYASHGNQWVSYDDVSEVKRKSRLIKNLNLGGGMIWALDLDDFRGRCGCGKHPLLRVLNQELRGGNFNARLNDCT